VRRPRNLIRSETLGDWKIRVYLGQSPINPAGLEFTIAVTGPAIDRAILRDLPGPLAWSCLGGEHATAFSAVAPSRNQLLFAARQLVWEIRSRTRQKTAA